MSKQNPTKLKKIVIAIAGEELELTPAQAKELRDILIELYGSKTVEHHHYDHWRPYYPYITYTTGIQTYPDNVTTCSTSSNVARLELIA